MKPSADGAAARTRAGRPAAALAGLLLGACLCLVTLTTPATAAPTAWTGATGDWFNAGQWSHGVPLITDVASVNNGGTAQASGGAPMASSLRVGAGTALAQTGTVSVTGAGLQLGGSPGSLLIGQSTVVGARSSGSLAVEAGVLGALSGDRIASFAIGQATAADTEARGQAQVGGNLLAQLGRVGQAISSEAGPVSFAQGVLNVEGHLGGVSSVGQAIANVAGSAATASGEVHVGGDLRLSNQAALAVGNSFGAGSAQAQATGLASVLGSLRTVLSVTGSAPHLDVGVAGGGTATGTLQAAAVDTSAQRFGQVNVGVATGSPGQAAVALGTLQLSSGELHLAGSFSAGVASGSATATGTAVLGGLLRSEGSNGSLRVGESSGSSVGAGSATASGSVQAAGAVDMRVVQVGLVSDVGNPSSTASGSLVLGAQGLRFDEQALGGVSALRIGHASASALNGVLAGPGGTATGSMQVNGGDITGYASVRIGGVQGSGQAQGTLALDGGWLRTRLLEVGTHATVAGTPDPANPLRSDAQGVLTVRHGGIDLLESTAFAGAPPQLGFLSVGRNQDIFSDEPAVARGELSLDNASLNGGVVIVGQNSTGRLEARNGSAIAVNSLNVGSGGGDGGVQLFDASLAVRAHPVVGGTGALVVGGGGRGELQAQRSTVSVADNLLVNSSSIPGTSGRVALEDSTLQVGGNAVIGGFQPGSPAELRLHNSSGQIDGHLRLGQAANAGTLFGEALLALDASLLTLGGDLLTDLGATVHLGLAGLGRGLGGYGAIDAFSASLAGSLVVDFLFDALLPAAHDFDLIVTTEVGAISGAFSQVSIFNLPSGYAVSYGVVNDARGGDIWRLSLRALAVPEPGSLALSLAALVVLAGLGAVQRRRNRARPRPKP